MFNFLKNKLTSLWQGIGSQLKQLFGGQNQNELQLEKLETLLLSNDVGHQLTQQLLAKIKAESIKDAQQLTNLLNTELLQTFQTCKKINLTPQVLLLVGINGVGKTSFAAKMAHRLNQNGKRTLLVAADTFRAAANDQLGGWANKYGIDLFTGLANQDPASVIFAGVEKFLTEKFDHLIIDTAGRLHTKSHLMAELEKINKVLNKKLDNKISLATWLVLDAMLGQSSLNQVELFDSATKLDALVLTKCDGSAKGGFIFAAANQFKLSIAFTSNGQSVDDLTPFDATKFITNFLE